MRAKQDGSWVPIDTTLQKNADGTIAPKASAAGLAFSGGGAAAPLAKITDGAKSYSVHAPWSLPAPTLAGSTATYASVLPGVDLVVKATPDGFSENLVITTRDAAANPALASIKFPVDVSGVGAHDLGTGAAAFLDGHGRSVFTTGTALMYDSSTAPDSSAAPASLEVKSAGSADPSTSVDDPDPGAKTSAMDASVTDSALTVTPDQSFLKDSTTTYPVVLDPQTTSSSLTGWADVWSTLSTTSFWKTSHSLGVGYDAWVDDKKARTFYQFDTHTLGGKKILQATFNALETWSANCTAKPVELWRTGTISSSTTWAKQPAWSSHVDTVSAAKGYSSSCPGGNVSFDATSAVSYTASKSASTTTLGVRASDEGDDIAWKQFASPSDHKPSLSVTFVSKPSTPTGLKLSNPNLACGASSSVAVNIRTLTPTLAALPQSADGSQSTLRPNFELYQYDPNNPDPLVASGSPSTWTTSGKTGTWTTPTLKNGQTYWFKARTEYKYSFNGSSASMYSGWTTIGKCAFHIDTSKPDAPTISSTVYPQCASADDPDTCTEAGGVGAPGSFTVKTAATDVTKLTYTLNDNKQVTKTVTAGTTSTSLNLAPDERGLNQLTVTAWDAAGNSSASATYYFKAAAGTPATNSWSFDEGSGTTAADSAGTDPATLAGGAGFSDHARLGKALDANGTTGYASAAGTGLDTSKSFTVSGWARLTDDSHNAVVTAQAGTAGSSFALYYSTAYKAWIFNRYTADVASPTIVRSIGTTTPVLNVWTHLTGVYDAQAQTIQLYVNGVAQGDSVAFTTPWKATGALQIGRGQLGAAFTDYFPGQIDELTMWNRILSPQEAADLEAETSPSTGNAQPAEAADWEFDDASGTSAADSSGNGHTATLGSGATLATDDDGGKGSVLKLDGTAGGYGTAGGPLVDAQGDFTVAAWVQLDPTALADTTKAHTMRIAGQSGTNRDSWGLWYSQPVGSTQGMWVFGRTSADTTAATTTSVPADITTAQLVDPGDWTLITGVYDGAHQQLDLYVNGVPQGATGDSDSSTDAGDSVPFTTAWQASGAFNIGRGRTASGAYGDPTVGLVDGVRVWTGVMDQPDIETLYANELPIPL
ncbi:hypothetical protein BIV57_05265 [Mangrovactinospora gilvigrisea]|uniref:LamG-like jellyroll fold domain-containing protein n=1 Tax=Mangrovactinospora gilvigrisea TaxID=1428644 RepID=A0A1J7BIY8_9ACTN|nr:hypothetical protein BIV57_05265 [Mangrovactinospora gilvigrisea]